MHQISPIIKFHQVLIENYKLDLESQKQSQKLIPRLNYAISYMI